jgi:hypothetical protein
LGFDFGGDDGDTTKTAALEVSVQKLEQELKSQQQLSKTKQAEVIEQKELAASMEKEAKKWKERAEKMKEKLKALQSGIRS